MANMVDIGRKARRRIRWGHLSVLVATIAAVSCTVRGRVAETWAPSDAPIKIRLRRYEARTLILYMAPYYYSLDSSANGRDDWREVAQWKTDDRHSLPKQQVRFIGDRVAYAFFRELYVVTTDGGKTWSTWNSIKALPSLQKPLIVDAKLDSTGRGTLIVQYASDAEIATASLTTTDYGLHWTMPNPSSP